MGGKLERLWEDDSFWTWKEWKTSGIYMPSFFTGPVSFKFENIHGEYTLISGLVLGKREDLNTIFAFVFCSQLHFILAYFQPGSNLCSRVIDVSPTHFILWLFLKSGLPSPLKVELRFPSAFLGFNLSDWKQQQLPSVNEFYKKADIREYGRNNGPTFQGVPSGSSQELRPALPRSGVASAGHSETPNWKCHGNELFWPHFCFLDYMSR